MAHTPAAELAHESARLSDDAAWHDAKASAKASRASEARWAGNRRRGVDPTTCERDYSAGELEFMGAIQEYKRSSGRMFPTWSEVLEVVHALGYTKDQDAHA